MRNLGIVATINTTRGLTLLCVRERAENIRVQHAQERKRKEERGGKEERERETKKKTRTGQRFFCPRAQPEREIQDRFIDRGIERAFRIPRALCLYLPAFLSRASGGGGGEAEEERRICFIYAFHISRTHREIESDGLRLDRTARPREFAARSWIRNRGK